MSLSASFALEMAMNMKNFERVQVLLCSEGFVSILQSDPKSRLVGQQDER